MSTSASSSTASSRPLALLLWLIRHVLEVVREAHSNIRALIDIALNLRLFHFLVLQVLLDLL